MEEQQKKQRPAGAKKRPAGTQGRTQKAAAAVLDRPAKKRPSAEADAMQHKNVKKTHPTKPDAAEKEAKALQSAEIPAKNPRKKRPAGEAAAVDHSDTQRKKPVKKRPAAEADAAKNSAAQKKKPVRKRPAADAGAAKNAKPQKKSAAKKQPASAAELQKKEASAAKRAAAKQAFSEKSHTAVQRGKKLLAPVRRSMDDAAERVRASAAGAVEQLGMRQFNLLMFGVFMLIYVIIGAFIIHGFTKKANTYLAEYEASRPQYLIEEYIESLDDSFLSEMAAQSVEGMQLSRYESADMMLDAASIDRNGTLKFTYQKSPDYADSHPSYYVLCNDEAIATVDLNRSSWTEKFSFPVWVIAEPVSVMELHGTPAYTVAVTAPQGATVKINGVEVPQDQFTEAASELQLTATELAFSAQPISQSCEISGLYRAPAVEVTDALGNVLTPEAVPDVTAARQEYLFAQAATAAPDEGLLNFVDGLTHAYMNYVINTRCDIDNNLAILNNYLMPGSTLAILMQTIYSDVWYNNDPNMREDHVYEVRNVRMYSNNLCTVDVHLESTIGKVAVNDYVGTVRWVLVNNGYTWSATNIELFPN